jgi:hypothetical protein
MPVRHRIGIIVLSIAAVSVLGQGLATKAPRRETVDSGKIMRVRRHLEGAESMLLARDVSGLTAAQRTARDRRITELRAYRERGVFPHNHRLPGRRTPVFVDEHGARCAMAHLIERSGGGELVSRIARTRNLARIRDLADDPALIGWLDRNGLTLAEAARVQPEYDGVGEEDKFLGAQIALASASTVISIYGVTLNQAVTESPSSRNRRGLAGIACGVQGGVIGMMFLLHGDGTARGIGVIDTAMGLISIGLGVHQLNVRRPSTEAVASRTIAPVAWRDHDGTQRVAVVMRF